MKSIEQKRKEANERAARNAKLSNQEKLNKAQLIADSGLAGKCEREIARLHVKIRDESLAKKA